MVSEVNEWRFLLFFFSPVAFCEPLAWGPDEDEEEEEEEEDEVPSAVSSGTLSSSMSCRAAELN